MQCISTDVVIIQTVYTTRQTTVKSQIWADTLLAAQASSNWAYEGVRAHILCLEEGAGHGHSSIDIEEPIRLSQIHRPISNFVCQQVL